MDPMDPMDRMAPMDRMDEVDGVDAVDEVDKVNRAAPRARERGASFILHPSYFILALHRCSISSRRRRKSGWLSWGPGEDSGWN